MKKKLIALLLALTLVMVTLAGCGSSDTSDETGEGELVDITLAAPTPLESFDPAIFYVGLAMGYFEEEGINLTLEDATGTDTKMVSSGQAEFAYPSPGVILSALEADMDVLAVGNGNVVNIFGFATNADSGIDSWDDLKGKSIALGDASWQSIAEPILEKAGIGADEVEWVVVGDSRFQSVDTGQTDALLTWLTEYGQCLGQGYDFDYLDGNEVLPQLSNGLVTSQAYADENPEIVEKMLTAYEKSIYFCYLNPEAVADIVLTECTGLEMTKDAAVGAAEYAKKSYLGLTEEDQEAYIESGIGYYTDAPWEAAVEASLSTGVITEDIDVSTIYTNEFVDETWDKTEVEADSDNYEFTSPQFTE